nr:hypothetical protein [Tanacetum cinerariifolium]
MGSITSIKSVLSQEQIDAFCIKFFVPNEVHPQLPGPDDTMHERPAAKIRLYTSSNMMTKSVEMDLHAFLKVVDPRKVKVVVVQKEDDEPRLLDNTVRRTVPLLLVTVVTSSGAIAADIEKMIDEGGSGSRNQADFAQTLPVVIWGSCVSGASQHAKKLREDHGKAGGSATGGKSPGIINRLLKNVVLNAEVGVQALSTLPIMTSSITPLPPNEGGDHTDFVTGPNLLTIGPSERYVISSDSSLHSSTNVAEAEVDSLVRSPIISVMTTATVVVGVFLLLLLPDHLKAVVARLVFSPVYLAVVLMWGISVWLLVWILIYRRYHEQLFDEFILLVARHVGLSAKVRMRAEPSIQKKQKLKSAIKDQDELLKTKDNEIDALKAQRLLKEATATEAIRLRAQTSAFESLEKSLRDEVNILKERNLVLKKERNALDVKVTDLEPSVVEKDRKLVDLNAAAVSAKSHNNILLDKVLVLETSSSALREKMAAYDGLLDRLEEFQNKLIGEMEEKLVGVEADYIKCCLRLEEKFYPSLLVGIAGRRWLLTHGIDHGKAGRDLADLKAYNPATASDFDIVVKELRELNFPILAELSSAKDASIMDVTNFLRLDDSVAEALGLTDFHLDENQLMVPIPRKEDQVVLGAQALSVSLSISETRVRKMKENLAEHWPILKDVFVLVEYPLSVEALTAIPEDYNVKGAYDDEKVQVGSFLLPDLEKEVEEAVL